MMTREVVTTHLAAGLHLRPVAANDRAFLFQLFSLVKIDELAAWQWDTSFREQVLRQQYTAYERHYHEFMLGVDDAVIMLQQRRIGRIIVQHKPTCTHLADIALLPEFRGKGFGSCVLRDLQAEAARGAMPIQLNVLKISPAGNWYRTLGFSRIGSTETHDLLQWKP